MAHVPSAILSVKEVKNELKGIRKLIKAGEKALAKLKVQESVLAKEVGEPKKPHPDDVDETTGG